MNPPAPPRPVAVPGQRCANSCGGADGCDRLDCCHLCALFHRGECRNDGTWAFVPRYFQRAFVV